MKKLALDILVVIGVLLMIYGLWLAWPPLGFIVGGLCLIVSSFFLGYGREKGSVR